MMNSIWKIWQYQLEKIWIEGTAKQMSIFPRFCRIFRPYNQPGRHIYTATEEESIAAIKQAPTPKTVHVAQLESFLGMINYYRKFIPNLKLSSIAAPLN